MYIERDANLKAVRDFIANVQPKLNGKNVAEEVYVGNELIGWNIVEIY